MYMGPYKGGGVHRVPHCLSSSSLLSYLDGGEGIPLVGRSLAPCLSPLPGVPVQLRESIYYPQNSVRVDARARSAQRATRILVLYRALPVGACTGASLERESP
jgi:hypothetical protein